MSLDNWLANDAYRRGYEYYFADGNIHDNPYDSVDEELWASWREGFYDAAWDD